MRNPSAYAAFLLPKLFIVYISVAVIGVILFFLAAVLYVHPIPTLITFAALLVGPTATKFARSHFKQLHLLRAMNSLIQH